MQMASRAKKKKKKKKEIRGKVLFLRFCSRIGIFKDAMWKIYYEQEFLEKL